MKKLLILAALAATAGCTTAYIETPEWKAKINSHWLKRDVDKFAMQRLADGSYSIDLNGYKSDASEQLPAFTREMWAGLGILGRLAASTINPVAASTPLTAEAADATQVAALVKATNEAKVQLANAKAVLAKAKADLVAAQASGDCTNGNCEK